MSEQPTPVVFYAAKSTEDKHGSIPGQFKDGREYVAGREGLVHRPEWEFSDEDESAYHGNRGDDLTRALAKCEELVAEYGRCILHIQHSDRLARGNVTDAKHLVEYTIWALKTGVQIVSTQDPEMFPEGEYGVLMGAIGGMRNHQDSKRKAQATADGMARSRVRGDAGWLFRGIQPDGWVCLREFDSRGQVTPTAIKDPDRQQIWELCWDMAREGKSAQAIQLEFSSRGFMTAPVKKNVEPRPFDVHRIDQALRNPIYAGYVTHKGEIVGEGDWPRYVEPEDWHAIQARRAEYVATRRPSGRPPTGYLLTGLARCGVCGGSMQATTCRSHHAGGPKTRRYLCAAHREYDSGSPQWCPAGPVPGELVDQIVLGGLDCLLADIDALRDQLGAGRTAEVERMGKVAEDAREDAAKADRVAERAQQRYELALEQDDEEAADIALTAVRNSRDKAKGARTRLDAALDALNAEPEHSDVDVMDRLWEVLSGRIEDAAGDVKKLNVALKETFDGFRIERIETLAGGHPRCETQVADATSQLQIVPVLSAHAIERAVESGRSIVVHPANPVWRATGDEGRRSSALLLLAPSGRQTVGLR